ncbi:MAG: NAD-dependent epimerase/dehydratase family protein [Oscillospiraceae bacterium]
MKKVLITGSNGFVGRNLAAELANYPEGYELMCADIDTPQETLFKYLKSCDFVVHLAGVNRPKDESEFVSGNANFTIFLLDKLVELGNTVPVAITSSVQSELDNAYGKSKAAAEAAVLGYGKENDVSVYVWKLPNVFGKWCRPNYNSAVATFCHNISHDLPVEVNAPDRVMTLIYIDELLRLLRGAIDGLVKPTKNGYCECPVTYECTLQYIPDKLYEFKKSRESLVMPSLENPLDKALYSTFLSYYDEDRFAYPLTKHEDSRGMFAEFFRTNGYGQWSVSTTAPHITRGNHWHHTKVEKFIVVSGQALIRFRKISDHTVIEYEVYGANPTVVDIPVGYTHSITNTSDTDMLITIIWANELFDPENADTFYLEV